MKSLEVNFDEAIRKNSAWHKSAAPHHRREEFFTALAEGKKGICSLILHSLRPTMRQHLSNLKYPRNFFGMLLATLMCGGGYRASIRCNDNGAHNDSRYSITLISFRFKSKSWKDYQMYIKLGG